MQYVHIVFELQFGIPNVVSVVMPDSPETYVSEACKTIRTTHTTYVCSRVGSISEGEESSGRQCLGE